VLSLVAPSLIAHGAEEAVAVGADLLDRKPRSRSWSRSSASSAPDAPVPWRVVPALLSGPWRCFRGEGFAARADPPLPFPWCLARAIPTRALGALARARLPWILFR
jgi:hypothetical protein